MNFARSSIGAADQQLLDLNPATAYIVVRKTQLCFCGTHHSISEIYLKQNTPSRSGLKTVSILRRLNCNLCSLEHKLPIELVSSPLERIPFCAECYTETQALAQLPPPPPRTPNVPLHNCYVAPEPSAPAKPAAKQQHAKLTSIFETLDNL